jgi:TonB-linked SusC/RagA family outer membrane protein
MQKITAFATGDTHVPEKAKLYLQLRFIMRVSVFCFGLLLITLQLWASNTNAQSINDTRINFSIKGESLKSALKELEEASGFKLFYPSEKIKGYSAVDLENKNRSVAEILNLLLANTYLQYKQDEKRIILYEKANPLAATTPKLFLGMITDEKDLPLPGVTIKIKNSLVSTITNSKGNFSIIVEDPNASLIISYVGYLTRELPVKDLKNPLNIKMEVDMSALDEVQVMAYNTTSKRLNTSNTVTITAEELERNPVPNVLQALIGRVPGMDVQQQSGQPGTPVDIRIRGTNTISGVQNGGQPLIVVDGVTYPSNNLPQLTKLNLGNFPNPLQGGNGLDYLNPQTIERIDVLKDIDATAIYGSRGAYGVIIITTKKGKNGVPVLNLNTYSGLSVSGPLPKMLNTDQYLTIRQEALKNDGLTPGPADLDLTQYSPTKYTDFGKLYNGRNALSTNSILSYSGGSNNTSYLIGGEYSDQQNIQRTGGQNRSGGLNFNINTTTPDQKFTIGLSGSYSYNVNTISPVDFTKSVINLAPNSPDLFLADGTVNWADYSSNPAAAINQIYSNQVNNLISNLNLTYHPITGLTFRVNFGFNDQGGKNLAGEPSTFFRPGSAFKTTSTQSIYDTQTWTLEPNASYTHQLGSKGTFTATTGGTVQNIQITNTVTTGTDFISDALLSNPSFAGSANTSIAYNVIPRRYAGFFAQLNYNWDNKYILNASGRYDGSSKFGVNNQFGTFGSLGAAYIISEEPWFKKALPFISYAKIHGSYGTVGGDNINDYQFTNTFANATGLPNNPSYQGNVSIVPSNLANPFIQWEKNKKSEIGLNMDFLKGRISVEGSYYTNLTSNELVGQPLSQTTGFTTISTNLPAIIKNWGYELVLNTKNINGSKFGWSTSFNITIPKSILEAYPGLTSATSSNFFIGQSVSGIKVYKYAGVNPQTGVYNFTNAQGLTGEFPLFGPGPTLDQILDKTVFIDLAPKFYGGLNNSFRYGNFSLDLFFTFKRRNGTNALGAFSSSPGISGQNYTTAALRRWQKPGDITDVPKASTGLTAILAQSSFVQSSGAYSVFTYARLTNANLAYQLPASLIKKLHATALKVYVQGQNLLLISNSGSNFDPDNFGIGVAPIRVFVAGINLTL